MSLLVREPPGPRTRTLNFVLFAFQRHNSDFLSPFSYKSLMSRLRRTRQLVTTVGGLIEATKTMAIGRSLVQVRLHGI